MILVRISSTENIRRAILVDH